VSEERKITGDCANDGYVVRCMILEAMKDVYACTGKEATDVAVMPWVLRAFVLHCESEFEDPEWDEAKIIGDGCMGLRWHLIEPDFDEPITPIRVWREE